MSVSLFSIKSPASLLRPELMKPKQETPQKFSSAHFSAQCLSFIRPLLLTHARIHTFTENLCIHHQYEPVPPAVQWSLFPAAVQQLMGKGNVFILSNLSRMWSHIWWESQFSFFFFLFSGKCFKWRAVAANWSEEHAVGGLEAAVAREKRSAFFLFLTWTVC